MSERILLSNDDGIQAPGLRVLETIAQGLSSEVWICAPEGEQSGAGHSLTTRRPLRLRELGERRYAVDGTPTDCVLLGVHQVMKAARPSLLLSGVNRGSNVAEDVTYSGTIAAAMEATLLGVPAIALSLRVKNGHEPHWKSCEHHAPALIRRLLAAGWPHGVLININFPDCAPEEVAGVAVVSQGWREQNDTIERRLDTRGEAYYWNNISRGEKRTPGNTDVDVLRRHYIAVTPLYLDLTHKDTMASLAQLF